MGKSSFLIASRVRRSNRLLAATLALMVISQVDALIVAYRPRLASARSEGERNTFV
jgi:hypothetical protein